MKHDRDDAGRVTFRPSMFLRLQRAWFFADPLMTAFFRCLPKLMSMVMLRSLAKVFGVHSVGVEGARGTFFGSPMDLGVFGEYLRTHTYAPRLVNFILGFFQEHGAGTFIDIGANIGLVTVPIARAGIPCIAFEPDPDNFRFLGRNVREAGVEDKVKLYNLALFDRASAVRFERSAWNFGDHRVRSGADGTDGIVGEQHRAVITVAAEPLDDIISIDSLKRPLVVKMDTEGSEVNIFKGGQKVISGADLVIFEYSPYVIRRMGENEHDLIGFAERHFRRGFVLDHHDKGDDIVFADVSQVCRRLRSFSDEVASIDHVDVFLAK